jgi:hypothetical protein
VAHELEVVVAMVVVVLVVLVVGAEEVGALVVAD